MSESENVDIKKMSFLETVASSNSFLLLSSFCIQIFGPVCAHPLRKRVWQGKRNSVFLANFSHYAILWKSLQGNVEIPKKCLATGKLSIDIFSCPTQRREKHFSDWKGEGGHKYKGYCYWSSKEPLAALGTNSALRSGVCLQNETG